MEEKKYNYLRAVINCGNGQRKWITAKTKEELDRKVLEARIQLGAGVNISADTTVAELCRIWFDVLKKPTVRGGTQKNVVSMLESHILPGLGNLKVNKVRSADIIGCMVQHGYSAKACNAMMLSTLRNIFDFAVDNDLILRSPVPKTYKAHGDDKAERIPLTPEQTTTLLANLKGTRAYLFTLIAISTGMRAGEIIGLKWDCVDLQQSIIHVRRTIARTADNSYEIREGTKTKTSIRDVPIPLALLSELSKIKHKPNDFVITTRTGKPFIGAMTGSLTPIWEKALPGVHVHAHLLRHTYATRLMENGQLDIQEVSALLGHSNIKITADTYVHYDHSRQEETAEKVRDSDFVASLVV